MITLFTLFVDYVGGYVVGPVTVVLLLYVGLVVGR